MSIPKDKLIQDLVPWIFEEKNKNTPPLINVKTLREKFSLSKKEYNELFRYLFDVGIWIPVGNEKLHPQEILNDIWQKYRLAPQHLNYNALLQERTQKDFEILAKFTFFQTVVENIKISTDIPETAKDSLIDFLKRSFEDHIWNNIDDLKELSPPSDLIDYWFIIGRIFRN